MYRLHFPQLEIFDNRTEEFIYVKETTLTLEHSLVSLSKWEQKWKKPFLSKTEKTTEESIDYIRCMTLTQNVDPNVYRGITQEMLQDVEKYIEDPMTATWFSDREKPKSDTRPITAELIYFWMIASGIPVEFQKWHLNRLITLIRVCQEETKPKKKRSKAEIAKSHKEINEERRRKYMEAKKKKEKKL